MSSDIPFWAFVGSERQLIYGDGGIIIYRNSLMREFSDRWPRAVPPRAVPVYRLDHKSKKQYRFSNYY